jgi:hypothetical protein
MEKSIKNIYLDPGLLDQDRHALDADTDPDPAK